MNDDTTPFETDMILYFNYKTKIETKASKNLKKLKPSRNRETEDTVIMFYDSKFLPIILKN